LLGIALIAVCCSSFAQSISGKDIEPILQQMQASGKISKQEAEITRKGQLEALQETEKQVTGMLLTKVASSRNQALSIIAQQQQHEANMAFYQEKKARLGVTSDEAYAASQTLSTTQAASSYSRIAKWISEGAKADQIAPLRLTFVEEGEQVKNAIRATATGNNGELLVDQATLRAQLDEVDQRVKEYSSMLDNQSNTKQLVDIMAERTAALDYKSQDIQIELAKMAPLFYAMKDNQAAGQWLWENAINVDEMKTEWQASSNPMLKMISRLSPQEVSKTISGVNKKIVEGVALSEDDMQIASETLTRKGATAAVKESYSRDPEQTLKNLSETPFRLKGISENLEWVAAAKTPEGKEQVLAIVSGSARRAIVSSFNESSKPRTYTSRGAKVDITGEGFEVPSTVVVKKKEPVVAPTSSRGGARTPQPVKDVWEIDTGGVWVSETYKSEVVNAYKLGTKVPSLWEDDFETVDEWVSSLFTRAPK
jgi:hypothetical protein